MPLDVPLEDMLGAVGTGVDLGVLVCAGAGGLLGVHWMSGGLELLVGVSGELWMSGGLVLLVWDNLVHSVAQVS